MLKAKTIGLDGSRAFLKYRTGIEEYSYQVVKHLMSEIPVEVQVRLYVRKKLRIRGGKFVFVYPEVDFALPSNWQLRGIWAPRFWTQAGLSLEMLFQAVDILFVPAHTLPLIGGKRNIVTVHGLEYEMSPKSYGFWERLYMRYSIRYSCRKADTVIAVSENTKQDLMRLYGTPEEKIQVIGEGFNQETKNQESRIKNHGEQSSILFIGRIEERKNVERIIEAFEVLKEQHSRKERLVLVGKSGHGYQKAQRRIQSSKFKEDIEELGYVAEEKKWELLQEAAVFVFPSLYEGFGLPVLEAQAVGVLVVTSNTSSLPEVGGDGAIYVDPCSSESIAKGIYAALQMSEEEKEELREKGFKNLERFSWEKCAREIAQYLA